MPNILIVDDDTRITDFLSNQLKNRGHQCSTANRGEKVIEKLLASNVDLLILDVMLPDVSGFEVSRRIRANTDLYTLPILFLTSMDSKEEIEHGLAQGADDYVTKPFDTAALLARIEGLLAGSANTSLMDDVTRLPNAKSIKLEIQKAITRNIEFSIGCFELMGITEFLQETDRETQLKALRHFGRCLHLCARQIEPRFFSIGHMGGGHFVFIVSPENVVTYAERVDELWRRHLEKFFGSVGKSSQIKHWQENHMLEYLLCVTERELEGRHSSRDLFETLSHLRASAAGSKHYGVFRDRRV